MGINKLLHSRGRDEKKGNMKICDNITSGRQDGNVGDESKHTEEKQPLTVSEVFRVRTRTSSMSINLKLVFCIQVEKLRQKFDGGLRTDIQGFHERYRERCEELDTHGSSKGA